MSGSTRAGNGLPIWSTRLRDQNCLSGAAACPAVCFVFSMPTSTAFWIRLRAEVIRLLKWRK